MMLPAERCQGRRNSPAAFDRRDDLVGDVLMDVEALLLGHGLFSSGLVAAPAATLPVGETGGSKGMGAAGQGDHPPRRAAQRVCTSPLLRREEDGDTPGRGGRLRPLYPSPREGASP
jgi:hypothetical protein